MTTATPLTAIFEQQRRIIEQTQNVALDAVTAQQTAVRQLVSGLETTKQLQTRDNELRRATLHTSLDAIEQTSPAVDLTPVRELVDEGIDVFAESYEQQWEMAIDGIEEFEDTADGYSETVDDSFDSFLDAQAGIKTNIGTVGTQSEAALPEKGAAD